MATTIDTSVVQDSVALSGEVTSNLEHLCSLNPRNPPATVRKTSIIATIGPASKNKNTLRKLIEHGMNIARLNLSHGSHEYHLETIQLIREVAAETPDNHVAIALDTKGPEIRTGRIAGDPNSEIRLQDGNEVILTTDRKDSDACTASRIYVDYKNIHKVVPAGGKVFVDDGLIALRVRHVLSDGLVCIVENGGMLGSNKGVNLPGAHTDLPAVTEKDREDLEFAVEHHVDMIFLSFIRDAISIKEIRIDMGMRGAGIKLIAKIENEEGVRNIDEILQEADGVMVARGDLGIEIPTEKVFIAQKSIIAKCNLAGKPVICATQMLESMMANPRATRAECSDIANAVLDGADCVMLSGETAKGKFPIEALQQMHQVCTEAEAAFYTMKFHDAILKQKPKRGKVETLSLAACTAVLVSHAKAIIVLSLSGITARLLAKFRPAVPIITLCRSTLMARQMHLHRGILPLYSPLVEDERTEIIERCLEMGIEEGLKRGIVRKGDHVILINSWPNAVGYDAILRVQAVE